MVGNRIHTHWLRGHQRVVLRRRKVSHAERMPNNDVRVVNAGIFVGFDPGWQAYSWGQHGFRTDEAVLFTL